MGWFRRGRSAAEAVAPEPAPPRPARRDWQGVAGPALAVQRQPAVLDPQAFQASLSTRRSPSQLTDLGHYVTGDAPAGILRDLPTHAVQRSTAAPATAAHDVTVFRRPRADAAPVQRSMTEITATPAAPEAVAPSPSLGSTATEPAPEQASVTAVVSEPRVLMPTVAPDLLPVPVVEVQRSAPGSEPAPPIAADEPAATPATPEDPASEPLSTQPTLGVAGLPSVVAPTDTAELPTAPKPSSLAPTGSAPSPSTTVGPRAVQRRAASAEPGATADDATPPLGLGLPVESTAPLVGAADVQPSMPTLGPDVDATVIAARSVAPDSLPSRGGAGLGLPQASVAPVVPIQRARRMASRAHHGHPAGHSTEAAPTARAATYAPPEPVVVSRLAASEPRPEQPGTRDAVEDTTPLAPLVGERSAPAIETWTEPQPPGPAQHDAGEGTPASTPTTESPAMPIQYVTAASPVAVQRSTPTGPEVLDRPSRANATATPRVAPRTAPAVQREAVSTGAPRPTSYAAAAFSPAAPTAWAGDAVVAAGVGHHAPDGSIVFGSWPEHGVADPGSPVVQRRSEPATDMPVPGTTSTIGYDIRAPVVQLAAAAAPTDAVTTDATDSPVTSATHDDLDELARRLYGRIRVQLRRELLLDRERAGTLIEVPR